ncbi:MAG: hypothetical protein AAGA03_10805 [Planctomycetota bacterium]
MSIPLSQRNAATEQLRQVLTVVALVMLAYIFTVTRVDETLRMVLAILLSATLVFGVCSSWAYRCWPLITLAMVLGIVARPLDVPNHHWMMSYLSASISIVVIFHREDFHRMHDLTRVCRNLLVVLMLFATFQKLLSPDFMDGSYIGFELARGGFASPVLKLVSSTREIVESNTVLIQELHQTSPAVMESVTLDSPIPMLKPLAYAFTASILLMEAWLCFSMWRLPDRRITHASLIAFATTLAVLRQEFTFISVVCTLGLIAAPAGSQLLRHTYAMLAVLTSAAVLKTLNV